MRTDAAGLELPRVVMEVRGLTKRFPLEGGGFTTACDGVNLRLYEGQTLGVIGESGCGKSTLARTILQIHSADAGEVIFEGKDILKARGEEKRRNWLRMQMVFQDPVSAFDPKMRVKDILCEPLLNFGLIGKKDVRDRAAELLRMVELSEDFMESYPHGMSGGQRQRLGIARALSLEPKVVICDEATSALDVSVQEKICRLLVKLQRERGISYLFICHDLGLVDMLCNQTAVMYLGSVVELIERGRISEMCRHPYTGALMEALFSVNSRSGEKIGVLEGEIPSPRDLPPGCLFFSRCRFHMEKCRREKPPLKEIAGGHFLACHIPGGVSAQGR